ncbi:hypothetical protein D3C87_1766190 [compost metagenome]
MLVQVDHAQLTFQYLPSFIIRIVIKILVRVVENFLNNLASHELVCLGISLFRLGHEYFDAMLLDEMST